MSLNDTKPSRAEGILLEVLSDVKYKNYFIYSNNRVYFDKKVQDLFDFDDIDFFTCKLNVIICYNTTYANCFQFYTFKFNSDNALTCDFTVHPQEFVTVELVKKHFDEFIDFLPELIEAYKNFKKKRLLRTMEAI